VPSTACFDNTAEAITSNDEVAGVFFPPPAIDIELRTQHRGQDFDVGNFEGSWDSRLRHDDHQPAVLADTGYQDALQADQTSTQTEIDAIPTMGSGFTAYEYLTTHTATPTTTTINEAAQSPADVQALAAPSEVPGPLCAAPLWTPHDDLLLTYLRCSRGLRWDLVVQSSPLHDLTDIKQHLDDLRISDPSMPPSTRVHPKGQRKIRTCRSQVAIVRPCATALTLEGKSAKVSRYGRPIIRPLKRWAGEGYVWHFGEISNIVRRMPIAQTQPTA